MHERVKTTHGPRGGAVRGLVGVNDDDDAAVTAGCMQVMHLTSSLAVMQKARSSHFSNEVTRRVHQLRIINREGPLRCNV